MPGLFDIMRQVSFGSGPGRTTKHKKNGMTHLNRFFVHSFAALEIASTARMKALPAGTIAISG